MKWPEVRSRSEFARPGVYILVGYREDDLPTVYIGQGDGTKGRIDQHLTQKDFWDRGIAFASTSGGLNRAHITWLEYALVNRAAQTKQCHLDNGNVPQEPVLTEAEKADTQGFLKEILQISPWSDCAPSSSQSQLPSRRRRARIPCGPVQHHPSPTPSSSRHKMKASSVCSSGRTAGTRSGSLEGCSTRSSTSPPISHARVSAITHYAPVDRIEPYGDSGKYKVVFSEPPSRSTRSRSANAPSGAMQGPRYTSFERLKSAKKLTDLFPATKSPTFSTMSEPTH